jgi:hypothetical protein
MGCDFEPVRARFGRLYFACCSLALTDSTHNVTQNADESHCGDDEENCQSKPAYVTRCGCEH